MTSHVSVPLQYVIDAHAESGGEFFDKIRQSLLLGEKFKEAFVNTDTLDVFFVVPELNQSSRKLFKVFKMTDEGAIRPVNCPPFLCASLAHLKAKDFSKAL